MVGSVPSFYSIAVTDELLDCLSQGAYPYKKTEVLKLIPPIPIPKQYPSLGIHPSKIAMLSCNASRQLSH